MKIVHIHDYSPKGGGGIEVNTHFLCKELMVLGNDVLLATPRYDTATYHYSDTSLGYKVSQLVTNDDLIRVCDSADVVHIHLTFAFRESSVGALERCVLKNIPCIVSIRTNKEVLNFTKYAAAKPPILKKIKKLLSAPNVTISAPSDSVKESLAWIGVRKPLYVVRNGITVLKYPHTDEYSPIKVDFTYVGNIAERKGIATLINSIALVTKYLPDVKVRLIGEGEERPAFQKMVIDLNIEKNVIFEGYQENEKLPFFLGSTKYLVHPSFTESWGNVVAEALAFGVPVIASKVGGLVELLQHGDFGEFVDHPTPESLANELMRVLTDKKFADRLARKAKRGKTFVSKTYTFEKQAESFMQLYKKAKDRNFQKQFPVKLAKNIFVV